MPRATIESPNLDRPWPPGQRVVDPFPIYDITRTRPVFAPERYRLVVRGAVAQYFALSWPEILALPTVAVTANFHCVTGWSKERLVWEGVPMRAILDRAVPADDAVQVMARGLEGYTTNLPLEHLQTDDVLLAHHLNGAPLTPAHGAPLRLVVPQLYAWKSAKYLTSLVFQTAEAAGYWEERGYHPVGDPWKEERYTEPVETIREEQRRGRVTSVERPDESALGGRQPG